MSRISTPSFANNRFPVANMSNLPIWDAVVDAIRTERNAMYFYQRASLRMRDSRAREIFKKLAAEEREHAEVFFDIYRGADIPNLAEHLSGPDNESDWLSELEGLLDGGFNDVQALQLAMVKEKHLERHLRRIAGQISDLVVRNVYEANAESTRQHYLLIETEYKRLTGTD
jgi:rubrerythrin